MCFLLYLKNTKWSNETNKSALNNEANVAQMIIIAGIEKTVVSIPNNPIAPQLPTIISFLSNILSIKRYII